MPITENEKKLFQAHPRPSSDCFKAIPIKKRRIFFPRSPSPPPKSRSPTAPVCGSSEDKPEPSSTPPACSNSEERPGPSVSASTFATTGCNPAQVNVVTSEIASRESHQFPSPNQAEFGTVERKPESSSSPSSSIARNPTQVNPVTGKDAICELPGLAGSTSIVFRTSEKKPNSSELESPFSKTGNNSAPVCTVSGTTASSILFEFSSLTPTNSDASEKKTESSNPNFPVPESGGTPGQGNAVYRESYEGPVNKDLKIGPKQEIIPSFSDHGFGLNLPASNFGEIGNVHEMVLSNRYGTQQVIGSAITSTGAKETFGASKSDSRGKGKLVPSEGIVVKQEELGLQNAQRKSIDTEFNPDSHIFLNRSNWDLNTPMDTWEGSSSGGSSVNNEFGNHDRQSQYPGFFQYKGLEMGDKQILHTEPSGTDSIQGNHELHKSDQHLKMLGRFTSIVDSSSEACLDLQLKPSFLSNQTTMRGEFTALKEMPFLSLATNPMSSQLSSGRTVKSEPNESVQMNLGKVQMGILKSLDLNHVKSEPCEGKETPNTTISGDLNPAGSRAIKPEPVEDQSQKIGRSFPKELCSSSIAPQSSLVHQNAGKDDSKASDVTSMPLVSDTTVSHSETEKLDVNIPSSSIAPQSSLVHHNAGKDDSKASDVTSKPKTPVPDSTVPHSGDEKLDVNIPSNSSNMVDKALYAVDQNPILENDIPISTAISESTNETATKLSTLVSKPLIADVNSSNLPHVLPCETASLPLTSLPEPLISNDQDQNPREGDHEFVAQGSHSDDEVVDMDLSDDEILKKPSLNSKVAVPGEVEGKVEGPGEVKGSVVCGATTTIRKQCGNDEEYEDGEVRDRALNVTVEGSFKESVGQLVKDATVSTDSVDVTVSKPLLTEKKESKVDSLKEVEALSGRGDDAGHADNKVIPSSSTVRTVTADSDRNRLSKNIRRTPMDLLKNNNKNLKLSILSSKTILPDQQQNVNGSNLAKDQVPSKIEPSVKDDATKDVNDRAKNRRIIYLNPASNVLAPGKEKLLPFQIESERPVDRSFRRDRSHSRGSRDDSSNERSRKVESERNLTHDTLEQTHTSNGARYTRPVHSAAEGAIGGSPDGSTRFTRRIPNEDMGKVSRFQYRRRSPGGRVQIPMGRHPMRDVQDFELVAHEEKLMRSLPEDMVEHSILPHPRSQYERTDEILIHRERRSFSPPMRRSDHLQLPPNQQRSSHQWSPPRRPDNFGGPQEFVRCRSPPVMRVNRMQPPHERPCFPEEIMVRRRGGSPPFMPRLPNNMMEHDFPRQVRGPNRIPRRFNMLDLREIAEEEYLGQMHEFGVEEDGFVEDRRCEERRGPVRPFRQQRCIAGDSDDEGFRFHVEDGPPPRVLRLRPDGNGGFPEGAGPRDFDLRFRNRLGNSSGRMRGIVEEQEGNYRHHEEQEWRGPTFNDGRPKRRRF